MKTKTPVRVAASEVYLALEGMLYLAMNNMQSSPRREANIVQFIDAVEKLVEAVTEDLAKMDQ